MVSMQMSNRIEGNEATVLSATKPALKAPSACEWLGVIHDFHERSSECEVIETRLSWVVLTPRFAYKVKKAVDFGEAQHRSRERRRRASYDEVWLNQHLAPGVYLGVVPIIELPGGGFRNGGKGVEVEWMVKMRRLRADRALPSLIRRDALTETDVSGLADSLADFYCSRPPETDQVDDLCSRLRGRVKDTARQVVTAWPTATCRIVRRLREKQRAFLDSEHMVLNLRVCDGRIVDGHGDLAPEHVFLERRPVVIDCVEYSSRLRKLDVLDDLARLVMECEHLGRADVAEAVMSTYRRRANDDGFPHLESFYKSLRACEQAAALAQARRESDVITDQRNLAIAMSYLDLARRHVDAIV